MVLRGMKNILQTNNELKILLEYNPKLILLNEPNPETILNDLIEYGFTLYDLEYDYNTSVNVEHFQKLYNNTNKLTNIFAIKSSR